jgi:hypothetical protein
MKRDKFLLFVADVTRYGSFASLLLATLLCVPSLEEFFGGRLSAISMLARFFVALAISTIGVRIASRTLLSYARQNLENGEVEIAEAHSPSNSEAA